MLQQRLVRVKDICADRKRGTAGLLSISRSKWWAGVANGTFPQPLRIGRATMWRVEDIDALVERLSAERK